MQAQHLTKPWLLEAVEYPGNGPGIEEARSERLIRVLTMRAALNNNKKKREKKFL